MVTTIYDQPSLMTMMPMMNIATIMYTVTMATMVPIFTMVPMMTTTGRPRTASFLKYSLLGIRDVK